MATKLYPPQLESNLPAFYKTYNIDNELLGITLKIPFGMSRAVNMALIKAMYCRIRTVSTNTLILKTDLRTVVFDKEVNSIATFTIPADLAKLLNEGQYYKVQLAFSDSATPEDETIGYFSTVGIIKCVGQPKVSIAGTAEFSEDSTNMFTSDFIGVYKQDTEHGDSTEKVYSYRFVLTNSKDEVIADSGVLLHDTTQDISSWESNDTFTVYSGLEEGEIGYIQYFVTTLNGLELSSYRYQIMRANSIMMENPIRITTENVYEEGYINVRLRGTIDPITNSELNYSGVFVITRSDDQGNYINWREIMRCTITGDTPSRYSFKDFTIQQGVHYRYGIQQYNSYKIFSQKILSKNLIEGANPDLEESYIDEPVYADFEDMFLYDGKRQLKIKFNPKVSSFKNTIPEQKIETIGSKYPFIFRNGHVCYKEFPIAGLVSYQMDEAMLFLSQDEELKQSDTLETDIKRIKTFPAPQVLLSGIETQSGEGYEEIKLLRQQIINTSSSLDGLKIKYQNYTMLKNSYVPIVTDESEEESEVIEDKNLVQINSLAQEIIDIYELNFEIINDMIVLSDDSYLNKKNALESQIKQLKQTLEIAKNNKNTLTTNLFHTLNAGYLQVSQDDHYVGSKQYYLKVVDDNGYKFVNYRPNSDWASAVAAGNVYIYDPDRYLSIIQEQQENERVKTGPMIRHDRNLTSRNMFSERYFKLKVLDWLTDGKVKLFKSPAEGNYLVRLLNVSMTPEDHLGRMIHSFTSTGYEIAELNYENLIYYGILNTILPTLTMNQWATKDINKILYRNQKIADGDDTGFYKIIDVKDETWSHFSCEGFAPGDIIRIYFGIESIDITIGATGAYTFDGDDRQITSVLIKPNPQTNIDDFMRQIFYESEGLSKTRFDTIADIKTITQVAEQFVGPKKDLMEPYNLIPQQVVTPGIIPSSILNGVYSSLANKTNINYYLNDNYKFNILDIERLKVRKRIVIPIYACENLSYDTETGKVAILDPAAGEEGTFNEGTLFFVTPFGKGYIYGDIIYNYDMDNGFYAIDSRMIMKDGKDVFLKIDPLDNVQLVSAVQVEDLIKVLPEFDYDGYAILQVYLPKITINNGEVTAKEWIVSDQKGRKYFDTFTHTWWGEGVEYDPTFSINNYPSTTYTWEDVSIDPITNKENIEIQSQTLQAPLFSHLDYTSDIENRLSLIPYEEYTTVDSSKVNGNNIIQIDNSNIIRLDPIDEMNFSKLDVPEKISLGNGVMAELTFRLQIIDYDIELAHEYDTAGKRDNYLAAKKELQDKITYYMDNATTMMEKAKLYDETVTALEESIQLIEEYQEAKDQINTLRTAFYDKLNNYLNNYFEKQNNLLVEIEGYLDSNEGTYPSGINQSEKLWDLKVKNTEETYETTYDEVPAREITKDPETQQFNRETLILVDSQQKSGVSADTGIETLAKNDPNYLRKINLLIDLFLSANNIVQELRSQIGVIPSTITTYGQYRQWLKDHIDEKVLYAFKYFHSWDSLEEDLSNINIAAGANGYNNVFLIPGDTLGERHSMFLLPTENLIHGSDYQWNNDPAYESLIPPGYRNSENDSTDDNVKYYKNIADGTIFSDETKIQKETEAFESYFTALQKFFGFNGDDDVNNKIWEDYNGYLLNGEDQSDFYNTWDEQYNQGNKTIKFIMAYPKNDVYNSLIDLAAEKDKYMTAYDSWMTFHNDNTNKNKIDEITANRELLAQKEAEQKKLQDQKTAAEILLNEPNSNLTFKKRSQLEELVNELTDTLTYLSEEIINIKNNLAKESSFISDWEIIDTTYNENKNNLTASANFFALQLRGYYESVERYVNLFINTDIFNSGILELIDKYVDTLGYADNDSFNMQNTYQAIEIYEKNAKNIMDKLHNILLSNTGLTETDQLNDRYKTAFSLWEDLKDYYKYYENDAKTGKLDIEYNKKETYEKLLETLQPWKDMQLKGFDSSQETEKIIYALAVYLASLGIEYKTEIEERYGI